MNLLKCEVKKLNIEAIINACVREIQAKQGYVMTPISAELNLVYDLGFTSLDVAELIACLEMDTGIDPFNSGSLSIDEVILVKDLYRVYIP